MIEPARPLVFLTSIALPHPIVRTRPVPEIGKGKRKTSDPFKVYFRLMCGMDRYCDSAT